MGRLPWWWWAYGVVLVIEALAKFGDTNEGKAILFLAAVLFLLGVAVTFVRSIRRPVFAAARAALALARRGWRTIDPFLPRVSAPERSIWPVRRRWDGFTSVIGIKLERRGYKGAKMRANVEAPATPQEESVGSPQEVNLPSIPPEEKWGTGGSLTLQPIAVVARRLCDLARAIRDDRLRGAANYERHRKKLTKLKVDLEMSKHWTRKMELLIDKAGKWNSQDAADAEGELFNVVPECPPTG